MAFAEFYMKTTGSDLNSGSTTADGAVYTSTGGNFDGTSVFTPTDGSTPALLIGVGDYVSLYNTGDTVTRCVAQVTAVGAGVNGTVTVSTTIKYGTVPTSNSGSRALKAGGAWASLAVTVGSGPISAGTAPQSTRINCKAGAFANTTNNRVFSLAGTATISVWYRGYKTTPGDQDTNNVAVSGTDIPNWDFTTGQMVVNSAHNIYSNIHISSQCVAASGAVSWNGSSASTEMYRCRITNTAANANSRALTTAASNNVIAGCWLQATTTADKVVHLAGSLSTIWGCTVTGGIIGVGTVNFATIAFTVFDTQAGDAISVGSTSSATIFNSSIYNPTGNGIAFNSTLSSNGDVVASCYFENVNQASKAAVNNVSGTNSDLIRVIGNTYYNCTANTSGITESFAIFDNGTLASAGFAAPGSHDFSVSTVAKGIGFPGAFENTSVYRGYLDPGAVQRQEPAASGMLQPNTFQGGYNG